VRFHGHNLVIELGIIPTDRTIGKITEGIQWNCTSWLTIAFLVIALVLVVRFLRTSGPAMLGMMSKPMDDMDDGHAHHAMSEH